MSRSTLAIASLYRADGTVLVLSWNAAVWATVLCVLGARAAAAVDTPAVLVFVGSAIGVLLHLIAEALGYCIAAVSAIFTSLALSKYGLDHPRMRSVMTSVSLLLISAVGLLALGAFLESRLAPQVLALLANR